MKKKYEENDIFSEIFIAREYESCLRVGIEQTFAQWMNSLETYLEGCGEKSSARPRKYTIKQLKLLQSLEKLQEMYSENVNFYHKEKFSDLIEDVKWALGGTIDLSQQDQEKIQLEPRNYKNFRKAGIRPMPSSIATILLDGLKISKKEFGTYRLFKAYYEKAKENNFYLEIRAEKLNKPLEITFIGYNRSKKMKLSDFFDFNFPAVPGGEDEDWVSSFRQNLERIEWREIEEFNKKIQKKLGTSNKYTSAKEDAKFLKKLTELQYNKSNKDD